MNLGEQLRHQQITCQVYGDFLERNLGRSPTPQELCDYFWTLRCLNPRLFGFDAKDVPIKTTYSLD